MIRERLKIQRSCHALRKTTVTLGSIAMIIENELRSEIGRAVRGDVSLSELYAWLMARSWNMHRDSGPAAVELAACVEALFFDQSSGVIDDAALREALAALVRPVMYEVVVRIGVSQVSSINLPRGSASLARMPEILVPLPA